MQIGGIYAQDGLDVGKARDSFVRAGDWYKQEDANALVHMGPARKTEGRPLI